MTHDQSRGPAAVTGLGPAAECLTADEAKAAAEAKRRYQQAYRQANKEKLRAYQRKYYASNTEKYKEYQARYWARRAEKEGINAEQ